MSDEFEAMVVSRVWKLGSLVSPKLVLELWVWAFCNKMNDHALEFLSFLILGLDFWFDRSTSIKLTSRPFWPALEVGAGEVSLVSRHYTFSLSASDVAMGLGGGGSGVQSCLTASGRHSGRSG